MLYEVKIDVVPGIVNYIKPEREGFILSKKSEWLFDASEVEEILTLFLWAFYHRIEITHHAN